MISAGPVEVIRSALEGIIPADHIYGTEFEYNKHGEIERILQVTAGYGKVAVIDQLLETLKTGPDRIVYVGDGSSDIHVMLHVNRRDGFTIAVSENKYLAPIAKRSVISDSALAILIPILEEVVGWDPHSIRNLFEAKGLLIQQWDKVQTDVLTIVPSIAPAGGAGRRRDRGLINAQCKFPWTIRKNRFGCCSLFLASARSFCHSAWGVAETFAALFVSWWVIYRSGIY